MAISVVDSGVSYTNTYDSNGDAVFTVTLPSGADVLVLSFAGGRASGAAVDMTVESITVDGNAMTVEGAATIESSTGRYASVCHAYRLSPPSGPVDIVVVTTSNNAHWDAIAWWALTGVDTSDIFGATDWTEGPDTQSVTLSSTVDGSWILAAAHLGDATSPSNGTITWTSPTTEVAYKIGSYQTLSVGKRELSTAGSYVIEATEAAANDLTISAIVLNAAASGTTEEASLTIARQAGAASAGGASAGGAMALGRQASAAAAAVAAALGQISLGTLREAVAAAYAVLFAEASIARTHGADMAAGANFVANVTVERFLGVLPDAEAIAEGATALLRQHGWAASATIDTDAQITLAITLDADASAGAIAAAETILDLLRGIATSADIEVPGVIDVSLTLGRTMAMGTGGQAIAIAVAELLRQNGMAANASVNAYGEVTIDYTLDAGAEGGNILEGQITIDVSLGTSTNAGQIVAGTVTIARTAGAAMDGGQIAEAQTTIVRAIGAAMAAQGIAAAEVTISRQAGAAAAWLNLEFSVNERRTYSVTRRKRRARIRPQARSGLAPQAKRTNSSP